MKPKISIIKKISQFEWLLIAKIQQLHKLFWAIGMFIATIIIGILGFSIIENYSIVEAFYMAVITFATVGFTEVKPLSNAGRIFTSFYIIQNLAIYTFLISVVTSYLIQGELRIIYNNFLHTKKVKKLNNHVIVCGLGKNGRRACDEFYNLQNPFIAIELNPEKIAEAKTHQPHILTIQGNATNEDILKEAGISNAKAIISSLPNDADNVFVTLTARQLNPNIKIIARVNEISSERKMIMAGANKLVRPDVIGGTYMAKLVTKPETIEFLDLINGSGDLKLEEFKLTLLPKNQHKSIQEVTLANQTQCTIIALKQAENNTFLVSPNQNTLLKNNDILIVLGTALEIKNLEQSFINLNLIS